MSDPYQDFYQLLRTESPDLEIEQVSDRSLDVIEQYLVFATSIGLFSGLWKVVELYVTRHASETVKISYLTEDGITVEIEYNNKTVKEVKELLSKHLPKGDHPVKISLKRKPKKHDE